MTKMKQGVRILAIVLMASLLLVSFAACGGGGEENEALLGEWKLQSISAMGMTFTAEEYEELTGEVMELTFTFQPKGKLSAVSFGESFSGTYKVDGDQVQVTLDGDTETMVLNGEELLLELEGVEFVLKK